MRRGFNDYRVVGDVAYLALTNRKGVTVAEALVDAADLPLLVAYGHRWCQTNVGGRNPRIYVANPGPTQYLHRLLLPDAEFVDHINGNGLDNRRSNLRLCTRSENARNSRKPSNNSSGYKGVSWHKRTKKWRADIRNENRQRSLGSFDNALDAAHAYDRAARVMHGEFARLNFPDNAQPALLRRPA